MDSLRSYDLNEIVISDGTDEEAAILTVQRLRLADLARTDAMTVERAARLIPSAHIQTNSRGESLVYLRSAGERQVAVFFDGALLNVPWDNRIDLSLVPTSMVGSISVAKGASSVLYGTNVLGGAVNLRSREADGPVTEVAARYADPHSVQVQLNRLGSFGKFSYALAAGYLDSDGFALSSEAELPFNQSGTDIRSNTDRRLGNVFGRIVRSVGERGLFSVSAMHYRGRKGVAPEGHLDPQISNVRYWRLPELQNSMVITNYSNHVGPVTIRSTVWASAFRQSIDQFETFEFGAVSDTQQDTDNTIGLRVGGSVEAAGGHLRMSINGLTSSHDQTDITVNSGLEEQSLAFRQSIFSIGTEFSRPLGDAAAFTFGGSLDGYSTPKTGDKPSRDPDFSYGVMAGATTSLGDDLRIRGSIGRKLRFPTPRELFGEALGRFLVNPDLRPESSILAEVGLALNRPTVSFEVIPFLSRTFDTIDRRNVELDGTVFRQRVNLEGSRVIGVEVAGVASASRYATISGNATIVRGKMLSGSADSNKLVEKPNILAALNTEFRGPRGSRLLVSGTYTADAYSLSESNEFVRLPDSFVLSARVSYLQTIQALQGGVEVFGRVDNLTDDVVLPQLGLPGEGRSVSAGMSLTF
ncbi:MAG: TonB-dependent receptor [Rhodothermales bacterium]|nr:TonB-dependent receptor [Rhodothermales bacterium]